MILKIDVKNIENIKSLFANYGKKAESILDDITRIKALDVVANAKETAISKGVFDNGKLVQNIKENKLGNMHYKIEALMPYSAYMEFGTGDLVDVPEELKSIAIKFKGRGIKKVNIVARPFMYPSFLKARKTYKKDIIKALKDLQNG